MDYIEEEQVQIEGLTQDRMVKIFQLLTGLNRAEAIAEIREMIKGIDKRKIEWL